MDKTEARCAALERKVERLTQDLDRTRRELRLSPILDDQVIAINARQDRGTAA